MTDERIRKAERDNAVHGTMETLDALDQELRRTGRTHPEADELRLQAATKLTLLVANRQLLVAVGHVSMSMGKTITSMSMIAYLGKQTATLARKARGDTQTYWTMMHGEEK